MTRFKTKYPGVFYRMTDRIGGTGQERVFYIRFKRNQEIIEEKVGRQYADAMTPAKANNIRSDLIEGRRELRKEKREKEKQAAATAAGKMTLSRLWQEYEKQKPDSKTLRTDKGRFTLHIEPMIGAKEPHELVRLDIDRLRMKLLKTHKPQTVRHVLGIIKRIVFFGARRQRCQNLPFPLDPIRVDNVVTEDLTSEQLKNLLNAIDNSIDIQAADLMRLALFTGMRRGEMFKLKWDDIDFQRGFISIKNPKGGVSQKIPLNEQARQVLENHPKTSDYVFVSERGTPFKDCHDRVNAIKKTAGLPDGFRALHGLRHAYASMLASSGKVDLYTIQRLLTHKSPKMTMRYAHLRDDALKNAANIAGQIIQETQKNNSIGVVK